MRQFFNLLFAALLYLNSAHAVYAGEWEALIIGNPGTGAEAANTDVEAVAQGLMSSGITKTTILRDATEADLDAALTALYGRPNVLVYIAAPYSNGEVMLSDQNIELTQLIKRLERGGTSHLGVLYENCAPNSSEPMQISAPATPEGISLFYATSATPQEGCPKSGSRLTDALSPGSKGANLRARIGDNRITASTDFPDVPMKSTVGTNMLPDIPVVSDDMVSLSPAVKMVHLGEPTQDMLTPVSLNPSTDSLPNKEVVVFSVPNQDQVAAVPLNEGLPRPFLILGTISEENAASFGPIEQIINLENVDFGYNDLDERRAFQQEDPEMFAKLVAGGALDPPPDQLAVALQTELQRMGCYRAGIDGDWGRGSQAAMDRYFEQAKTERVASTDPTAGLFRKILLKDDITCPAPAPAPAPATVRRQPQRTAPAANTRATRQARPARRQPARTQTTQRAPAQQRPAPTQIRPGATLGVFR